VVLKKSSNKHFTCQTSEKFFTPITAGKLLLQILEQIIVNKNVTHFFNHLKYAIHLKYIKFRFLSHREKKPVSIPQTNWLMLLREVTVYLLDNIRKAYKNYTENR
jgi:hypothetical protein